METFFTEYLALLHKVHSDFIATFDGLPDEALDWVPGEEMNPFGALVVHTTASARFWLGDVLVGDPSNRDRASEFQARGLSAAALKTRFAAVEDFARAAFERITLADLNGMRPAPNRDPVPAAYALLHALDHTALHLGHAQITRQLWDRRED